MENAFIRRIGKYKFHYVIIIPAMLLLFVFKVIPFIFEIILSFKNS